MSTINTALADQLGQLNLQPWNFTPQPQNQQPRCMCHNKYLDKCPTNGEVVRKPVTHRVERSK